MVKIRLAYGYCFTKRYSETRMHENYVYFKGGRLRTYTRQANAKLFINPKIDTFNHRYIFLFGVNGNYKYGIVYGTNINDAKDKIFKKNILAILPMATNEREMIL